MTQPNERQYDWSEVKELSKDQLVVVLFGGLYDLTKFAKNHPGGLQALTINNGLDATEVFIKAGHLSKAFVIDMMSKMRIGALKAQSKL